MKSMMTKAFLLAGALALGGCAATVTRSGEGTAAGAAPMPMVAPATATQKLAVVVVGSPAAQAGKDWAEFRGEYRNALAGAAAAANLGFSYFENEPVPAQPAGTTLVRVKVNDYRYLSTGARIGLGIFTGNAYVDSDVEFVELPARRTLGTRKYSTSSSAWQGVFSAMTDAQLKALSAEIVKDAAQR